MDQIDSTEVHLIEVVLILKVNIVQVGLNFYKFLKEVMSSLDIKVP